MDTGLRHSPVTGSASPRPRRASDTDVVLPTTPPELSRVPTTPQPQRPQLLVAAAPAGTPSRGHRKTTRRNTLVSSGSEYAKSAGSGAGTPATPLPVIVEASAGSRHTLSAHAAAVQAQLSACESLVSYLAALRRHSTSISDEQLGPPGASEVLSALSLGATEVLTPRQPSGNFPTLAELDDGKGSDVSSVTSLTTDEGLLSPDPESSTPGGMSVFSSSSAVLPRSNTGRPPRTGTNPAGHLHSHSESSLHRNNARLSVRQSLADAARLLGAPEDCESFQQVITPSPAGRTPNAMSQVITDVVREPGIMVSVEAVFAIPPQLQLNVFHTSGDGSRGTGGAAGQRLSVIPHPKTVRPTSTQTDPLSSPRRPRVATDESEMSGESVATGTASDMSAENKPVILAAGSNSSLVLSVFVDDDGNILWYPVAASRRRLVNLTRRLRLPRFSYAFGRPVVFEIAGTVHVIFTAANGHIHQLVHTPTASEPVDDIASWRHRHLSALLPDAIPAGAGNVVVHTENSRIHVFYIDGDNFVHELLFMWGRWYHYTLMDMIRNSPAPPAVYLGNTFNETFSLGLHYLSTDGACYRLSYSLMRGWRWAVADAADFRASLSTDAGGRSARMASEDDATAMALLSVRDDDSDDEPELSALPSSAAATVELRNTLPAQPPAVPSPSRKQSTDVNGSAATGASASTTALAPPIPPGLHPIGGKADSPLDAVAVQSPASSDVGSGSPAALESPLVSPSGLVIRRPSALSRRGSDLGGAVNVEPSPEVLRRKLSQPVLRPALEGEPEDVDSLPTASCVQFTADGDIVVDSVDLIGQGTNRWYNLTSAMQLPRFRASGGCTPIGCDLSWGRTIVYVDDHADLHAVFEMAAGDGTTAFLWKHRNITTAVPGAKQCSRGGLFSVVEADLLHVFYLDKEGHVHHLRWDGHMWSDEDLWMLLLPDTAPPPAKRLVASFASAVSFGVKVIGMDGVPYRLACTMFRGWHWRGTTQSSGDLSSEVDEPQFSSPKPARPTSMSVALPDRLAEPQQQLMYPMGSFANYATFLDALHVSICRILLSYLWSQASAPAARIVEGLADAMGVPLPMELARAVPHTNPTSAAAEVLLRDALKPLVAESVAAAVQAVLVGCSRTDSSGDAHMRCHYIFERAQHVGVVLRHLQPNHWRTAGLLIPDGTLAMRVVFGERGDTAVMSVETVDFYQVMHRDFMDEQVWAFIQTKVTQRWSVKTEVSLADALQKTIAMLNAHPDCIPCQQFGLLSIAHLATPKWAFVNREMAVRTAGKAPGEVTVHLISSNGLRLCALGLTEEDLMIASRAYSVISVGPTSAQGPTRDVPSDSSTSRWNENYSFAWNGKDALIVALWQWSPDNRDELIGSAPVSLFDLTPGLPKQVVATLQRPQGDSGGPMNHGTVLLELCYWTTFSTAHSPNPHHRAATDRVPRHARKEYEELNSVL